MMSLWDALRMNMMISYQELVRTFLNSALAPRAAHRATRILQLFYHSSISSVRPRYHRLYQMIF
ncbi:hypothetical protein B5M10_22665 [Pluralibacter gergoviae]|nr:hypothetical protein B5M10_22665 [Pluralibacter gergoviae]